MQAVDDSHKSHREEADGEAAHFTSRDPGALASLRYLLQPIASCFAAQEITDVVFNQPGSIYLKEASWRRVEDARLTLAWARALVTAAAVADAKHVSTAHPFLSAALPHGIRMTAVLPPACRQDRIILSFRVAAKAEPSEKSFAWRLETPGKRVNKKAVLDLFDIALSLSKAILERENVVVIGATGAGKTTLLRHLISSIDCSERIVTLEDVRELQLPRHDNHVHLFFGDNTGISASACFKEALRLRPDRIILGECRGAEAFDFLQVLLSGHRGAMTTLHADSTAHAYERLVMMARMHAGGAQLDPQALMQMFKSSLDIVVRTEHRYEGPRWVTVNRWA